MRTEITPTELIANAANGQPAQTEVLPANDAVILMAGKAEETILEVTALEAGCVVEIVAGDNPPALSAGQGVAKSAELAESAVVVFGPLTSARFIQAGADAGSVFLDTNKKIKVRAYHVPRTA
jgi:hypothetical protein